MIYRLNFGLNVRHVEKRLVLFIIFFFNDISDQNNEMFQFFNYAGVSDPLSKYNEEDPFSKILYSKNFSLRIAKTNVFVI